MYRRNPLELVADRLGSAEDTLGTTAINEPNLRGKQLVLLTPAADVNNNTLAHIDLKYNLQICI